MNITIYDHIIDQINASFLFIFLFILKVNNIINNYNYKVLFYMLYQLYCNYKLV